MGDTVNQETERAGLPGDVREKSMSGEKSEFPE